MLFKAPAGRSVCRGLVVSPGTWVGGQVVAGGNAHWSPCRFLPWSPQQCASEVKISCWC